VNEYLEQNDRGMELGSWESDT